MHQTFYIDIDEEITSIIERLKKTKAKEIIIVVPKRALLIQSIINLKLLKKESDKLKREIIIVTQDKLGKMLVEKAGIIAEQKLDEVEDEEPQVFEGQENEAEEETPANAKFTAQKNDLKDLGSESYFEALAEDKPRRKAKIESPGDDSVEKILNKELVSSGNGKIRNKFFSNKAVQSLDMVKNIDIRQSGIEEQEVIPPAPNKKEKKKVFEKNELPPEEDVEEIENALLEEKEEEFFSRKEKKKKKEELDSYHNVQVGGKVWKVFLQFLLAVVIVAGLVGAYLYIPQVLITLNPKVAVKTMDFELDGLGDISNPNFVDLNIPVEVVDLEKEITKDFITTGKKTDSNKKARGMITIYNEYSSSSQPLVATTRFLSEDGKLFRLEKSITVPGSSNVGGEIKPGVIEALVMADEAGSEYNIEATKFSIPGFKGSGDKYTKIYAKSPKKMIGGGESATEIRSVSESDIANAKISLTSEIKESLTQEVQDQGGEDRVILGDAISFGEVEYLTSVQEGNLGEEFSLTGKANGKFIVFKKSQLRSLLLEKIISAEGIKKDQLGEETFKFEFGKSDADFEGGRIIIRVSLKARILPDLDLSEMKADILGKSEEEFADYIGKYKGLESANITYKKSFFSGKIPSFSSRVELTLDNN